MSDIVIQAEPIRMTRTEAARYIGVSPRKLQRLVSNGHIRFVVDDGGVRLYPTDELKRYVEQQKREQWR